MLIRRNRYFHFFFLSKYKWRFVELDVPLLNYDSSYLLQIMFCNLSLLSSQRSSAYNWECTCFARGTLFPEIAPAFAKVYLTLRLTLSGVLVPDGTQWVSRGRKGCWRKCRYSNVVMSNAPNKSLLCNWPDLMWQQFIKLVQSNPVHFKTILLYSTDKVQCNMLLWWVFI